MKNRKAAPVCAACPAPPLNPAHRKLTEWFGAVRFRHTLLFGVDEAEMWKKLEELNRELEKANSLVHELANMRITIIANLGQR